MSGPLFLSFFFVLLTHSDAIRCFDCHNIPFPRDCAEVTECNSGEYCFTEQIVTTSGHVVYNIGCLTKLRCSSVGVSFVGKRSTNTSIRAIDLSTCTECCTENFCNRKGCGVPDIPFEQRGPYCYNCDAVIDPKACEKVAVCLQNEMCMLYSPVDFRGLPETIYRSKCGKQSTCDEFSTTLSIDKCAVTCCSTDFCNDHCDTSQNTSITMTTGATPTTNHIAIPTTNSHLQVTAGTTLPSSSHSPSTSRAPFHCRHDGGYISINSSQSQLCVHIVLRHSTWDEAQSACRKEGGDLVVLDTLDKALLMKSTLTSKREYDHSGYWIGARDISNNNQFHWINNIPFDDSQTDWAKNEPDHHDSSHKLDCVAMVRDSSHHSNNFRWHDNECSDDRNYICERH